MNKEIQNLFGLRIPCPPELRQLNLCADKTPSPWHFVALVWRHGDTSYVYAHEESERGDQNRDNNRGLELGRVPLTSADTISWGQPSSGLIILDCLIIERTVLCLHGNNCTFWRAASLSCPHSCQHPHRHAWLTSSPHGISRTVASGLGPHSQLDMSRFRLMLWKFTILTSCGQR